jgi:hypothetical protein
MFAPPVDLTPLSFASLLTSKPRDVVHSIFNELTAK